MVSGALVILETAGVVEESAGSRAEHAREKVSLTAPRTEMG
jgi:hypothetical protein